MAKKYTKQAYLAAEQVVADIEAERHELTKHTDKRYARAKAKLDRIEQSLGVLITKCEGCGTPLFEREKWFPTLDGCDLCVECAPNYKDMLEAPQIFVNMDLDDGSCVIMHTAESVKPLIDAHIAAGGSLDDSLVA